MRTILLTGASSGIGKCACEHMIAKGYHVIGLSRRTPNIASPQFTHIPTDLSKPELIEALCKRLLKEFPDISGLICNAGVGYFKNLEEMSSHEITSMLHVNFLSHVYLSKYFVPHFKKQAFSDIIFIGSEAALAGKKKGTIYCGSKFALRGFAQALREECNTSHVRVSSIQPGMTRTNFYQDLSFAPGKDEPNALLPEDIAQALMMILELRSHSVCDEIILSPLKHVIQFK